MLSIIDCKTFFESTNIGIAAIEADAVISMANAQLLKLLQLDENEFVGTIFLDWIYDKEDRKYPKREPHQASPRIHRYTTKLRYQT